MSVRSRTGSGRNEVKDEDANLVCVGVVDSLDAAVHPFPAQTKKHAHKDCTEFPLGDRPSDTRTLGDSPASPEILATANTFMADSSRRRIRAGRDLARIERRSPPGKAMANKSRNQRRP